MEDEVCGYVLLTISMGFLIREIDMSDASLPCHKISEHKPARAKVQLFKHVRSCIHSKCVLIAV